MTQQEKDILIGKMIDSPSDLTDAELDIIVNDEDLRDIHEASATLSGACIRQPEIDVEKEWRLFRHRLQPKRSPWRWAMRVAAIFLGAVVAAGAVRFAIDRFLTEEKTTITAETRAPKTDHQGGIAPLPELPTLIETEKQQPPAIAQGKPKRVKPTPSEPVNIEEEEEIDIDEYLRLQQARVDHEVAMVLAELYINELQALESPLTPEGTQKPTENEVRYIIMQ